ncbi:MAG: grasp-with-spasm system ATP-grasp peptide maturase [Flavobacterium sp. BFFFF2]|nr:MAG: grasp-with-spasm system ATP-grasp peptide maturase [Flavobacterium sp. BFFFF2]
MILILSDAFDNSTTRVIEWLNFLNKKWIRINAQDTIEIEFIGTDIVFKKSNTTVKLSEIKSFWYRRGFIAMKNNYSTHINAFSNLQSEEISNLIEFIYFKLTTIKHINKVEKGGVNKLIVSNLAREIDIMTPVDLVFSKSKSLKSTLSKEMSYITKVVSGQTIQEFENFNVFNYTSLIDSGKICTETFFPSLVQNYIKKKYELRIFYLVGTFYSMAIFSQNDDQTILDFRNYNKKKPNRTVPYKLPEEIEIKLDLLMKKLDVNCGSIDVIVTPENDYVFLEINPVGQFGMVSHPCNYNLEKKIAEYL